MASIDVTVVVLGGLDVVDFWVGSASTRGHLQLS